MGELLNLGGKRFETLKAVISNDRPKNKLEDDSRTATWSRFYDNVLDSPFLGNGYGSFQGDGINHVGVHNTYLLIIGESGIIPFIVFIFIVSKHMKLSWKHFKDDETLLYMSITMTLYLLTLHDFFEFPFMLSLILFWFNQTKLVDQKQETLEKEVLSN